MIAKITLCVPSPWTFRLHSEDLFVQPCRNESRSETRLVVDQSLLVSAPPPKRLGRGTPLMAGLDPPLVDKIVKILGRMKSRTVMMERFQDAEFSWHFCPQKTVTIPRRVCVLYLLFTQPSLIRSFHSSDPCFSVSSQRGSDMRGSTL